jgi:two-component system response regulator HydG
VDIDVSRDSAHLDLGARSARMRAVVSIAERVAPVDSTVLLTGESGVGKERLARFIHGRSRRTHAPFVALNCGALTETLLESELFGHKRGAFTGAHVDRPGLFETADKGSLFLDEIGEMPLEMQATLLRVLQEREVRRVGDNHVRRVDVRIVAATNRDLVDDVHAHRFRGDLYYRVSVVVIRIPPLRERPDDLQFLLHSLLATTAQRVQRAIAGYTPRALERLGEYPWPGNIRELQNAIEHACILAGADQIDVDDLPEQIRTGISPPSLAPTQSLADVEREHILRVLEQMNGDRRRAAAQLQIGIATLHRKLRRYQRELQPHRNQIDNAVPSN